MLVLKDNSNESGIILKLSDGSCVFGFKTYEDKESITLRDPIYTDSLFGRSDYHIKEFNAIKETKFLKLHIMSETVATLAVDQPSNT